ncbi:DUF3536 domain-containing protein [Planctomycetota bacterium]
MNRYVCIHGHFYQPPRENPWLEDVELQDEAYPYHDWNSRITEECYRQNVASRILDSDKKIIDIVNNYSKMSFDFGPTLLSWLQKHAPEVYKSIIEADKESREFFSGHGAALAQPYNHIIMPLANTADKHTQVIWGIRDFEQRFQRRPEGMWLPETAVDIETLEVLTEHEIKFTILAPHQAARVRKLGTEQWEEVNHDNLNTTISYICELPSGRQICLFFYNGPVSYDVSYGTLLKSGSVFAQKLMENLDKNAQQPQLANIATDGETYGHHHRHADMALAYCLDYIETNNLAKPTVYAEFLEKFPPAWEVEIKENTSWSCPHGIERWRGNCSCFYGRFHPGKQQFRAPLREAMNWLRDRLASIYENKIAQFVTDPWQVRNKYISVINDRALLKVEGFLSASAKKELTTDDKITILKFLEMQRMSLLMFTSCGWFFDDCCGIETIQILQYAARAIQLAKETTGEDLEPAFMDILKKAPVNTKAFENGKDAYQKLVKTASIDLNRVGAHLAVSSIFNQHNDDEKENVYCYAANIESYKKHNAGFQTLATGRATVQSEIVLEKHQVDFVVLHLGSHNLICAVADRMSDTEFLDMQRNLENAFREGNTTEVMRLMNVSLGDNNYSLRHLLKDEQRRILYELLETTWQEIRASFLHIYEQNYTVIELMRGMNIPLPKTLSAPAEFILNQELTNLIRSDKSDLSRVLTLVNEAERLSLNLDQTTLYFEATRKVNRLMSRLQSSPNNLELLEKIKTTLQIFLFVSPKIDLQEAQNIFFALSTEKYPLMRKKADSGNEFAGRWVEKFENLANYLTVKIPQWLADKK